jgi:transposase-like protein
MTKRRIPRVDQNVLSPAIPRILSTTTIGESPHVPRRKIIKTGGHLPTDEAALEPLYLALRNIQRRWLPSPEWRAPLPHFEVLFGDRFVPETYPKSFLLPTILRKLVSKCI